MAQVAVGGYALHSVGLASYMPTAMQFTTDFKSTNNLFLTPIDWYYVPDIGEDESHIRGRRESVFGTLYYPTAERAIVDNIRHQDVFEEFFLVEALQRYERDNPDLVRLREVAAEYGQSEQLEYWLEEARNDKFV